MESFKYGPHHVAPCQASICSNFPSLLSSQNSFTFWNYFHTLTPDFLICYLTPALLSFSLFIHSSSSSVVECLLDSRLAWPKSSICLMTFPKKAKAQYSQKQKKDARLVLFYNVAFSRVLLCPLFSYVHSSLNNINNVRDQVKAQ